MPVHLMLCCNHPLNGVFSGRFDALASRRTDEDWAIGFDPDDFRPLGQDDCEACGHAMLSPGSCRQCGGRACSGYAWEHGVVCCDCYRDLDERLAEQERRWEGLVLMAEMDVSAHVYPNGLAAGRFELAREARGWSIDAVAFHADVPPGTIADVERGTLEPYPALTVKVADLLGFPVGFFAKPVDTWLEGPMFICGRGPKRPAVTPRCRQCQAPHTHLCDYPIGEGKTCSAPLCRLHRVEMAPGVDYCPAHAQQHQQRIQPSLL